MKFFKQSQHGRFISDIQTTAVPVRGASSEARFININNPDLSTLVNKGLGDCPANADSAGCDEYSLSYTSSNHHRSNVSDVFTITP
jgi:hypothetical protein